MTEPTPIVVGTDGSPCADLAVEWAAASAGRRGRPLHIVHAVEPWEYDARLPLVTDAPAVAGERILLDAAALAGKVAPDIEITTELVFDGPAHALRAQAERTFEVVVGHRGLGGFTGLLLGSTGLKVAGHTSGPVVVVRGSAGAERREVLVGVDPAEDTTRVLAYAFETASLRAGWVRAVHIGREPRPAFNGVTLQSARAGEPQEHLTKAVAPWRAKYPGVRVIEEALRGDPVRELVERSRNADLVVVGSHHPYTGAVGHGLIHHADCPVAVMGAAQGA